MPVCPTLFDEEVAPPKLNPLIFGVAFDPPNRLGFDPGVAAGADAPKSGFAVVLPEAAPNSEV